MNEAVKDVLVAAALAGHQQAFGVWHEHDKEADCVIGLLHLTVHPSRVEAIACGLTTLGCWKRLYTMYGLLISSRYRCLLCLGVGMPMGDPITHLTHLNDYHKLDFLEIARKYDDLIETVS